MLAGQITYICHRGGGGLHFCGSLPVCDVHVPINVCYTAVLRAPVPRRGERGERHRIRNSAVSYPDPT